MKVIVPFTKRHPEVEEALAPYDPCWVDVSGEATNYWALLKSLWEEGERFINVEHDNVPHAGALEELWECPFAWCAFPYLVMGRVQPALGCTKFHEVLIKESPDLFDDGLFRREEYRWWPHLDVVIAMGFAARGIGLHLHPTVIGHLNPTKSEQPDFIKGLIKDTKEVERMRKLAKHAHNDPPTLSSLVQRAPDSAVDLLASPAIRKLYNHKRLVGP